MPARQGKKTRKNKPTSKITPRSKWNFGPDKLFSCPCFISSTEGLAMAWKEWPNSVQSNGALFLWNFSFNFLFKTMWTFCSQDFSKTENEQTLLKQNCSLKSELQQNY